MDEKARKSCWGITAWAMLGFAGVVALAFLIGGETTALLAAG